MVHNPFQNIICFQVRKAQLQQLLKTEKSKYEEELSKLNLALYKERL